LYDPFELDVFFLFHKELEESWASKLETAVSYEDAIDVDDEEDVTVPGVAV
jgi:hypothetical protein